MTLDLFSVFLIGLFYVTVFTFFLVCVLWLVQYLRRRSVESHSWFHSGVRYPDREFYDEMNGKLNGTRLPGILAFRCAKDAPFHRVMQILFHISLVVILIVHINIVTESWLINGLNLNQTMVLTEQYYFGFALAVMLLVTGSYFLVYRASEGALTIFDTIRDYLGMGLLMALGVVGAIERFWLPMDIDMKLQPFMVGMFNGSPQPYPDLNPVMAVHIVLACAFILWISLDGLQHPFSSFSGRTTHGEMAKMEKMP
jgi:nitrate reductase gamma subunit